MKRNVRKKLAGVFVRCYDCFDDPRKPVETDGHRLHKLLYACFPNPITFEPANTKQALQIARKHSNRTGHKVWVDYRYTIEPEQNGDTS